MIWVIKMSRYLDASLSFLRHIPEAVPFYSQFVKPNERKKKCLEGDFQLFIIILFYSSTSNLSKGDYVQHVFSVVPALLALAGSLMVLFFRPPSCRTKRGWYGFKASHAIMSYHQLNWLRCSFCTIIFNKHNQYDKNHLWTLIMSMQFVNEIMIEFQLLYQTALYRLFYISLP